MNADHTQSAAALVWQALRDAGSLSELPGPLRPQTAAEGLAIQALLPAAAGQAVRGWKLAATSQAGQAHIQVSQPLPGRILEGWAHAGGERISLRGNHMHVAEPEFAFRIGRTLPPRATRYERAAVLAAVESLHPAFEIPNSRFADFARAGEAQLLADNACCGHFVFGAAAPGHWRELDLARHVVRGQVSSADGRLRLVREGDGRAVLGDPREALAWLANRLSDLGIALEAGQWVSTGTCMVPLAVQAGDAVFADYGVLGGVTVQLAA